MAVGSRIRNASLMSVKELFVLCCGEARKWYQLILACPAQTVQRDNAFPIITIYRSIKGSSTTFCCGAN